MNDWKIRLLEPPDAAAFVRIRRTALETEPLAFATSLGDDRRLDHNFVRQMLEEKTAPVLGAFAPQLLGIVGLRRETYLKLAHKIYVWGFFVDPAARGRGFGGLLLEAAIRKASETEGVSQLQLWVSTSAGTAIHLYQKHGFTIWGTEPNALNHGGRFTAGHHMVLALK
jgi:GNAT superfamily N-acetyltransferase